MHTTAGATATAAARVLVEGKDEILSQDLAGRLRVLASADQTAVGRGIIASASFTPAAAAYSAGDIQSVAQAFAFTFADGTAIPAGSLIRILTSVLKIDVTSVPSGMTSFNLQLYSATPPSAQADNDAWTLASADLSVYSGALGLGAPVDLGASLYVRQQYLDTDIKLTTASLFGQLVTVGAYTAAATAIQVSLRGIIL